MDYDFLNKSDEKRMISSSLLTKSEFEDTIYIIQITFVPLQVEA